MAKNYLIFFLTTVLTLVVLLTSLFLNQSYHELNPFFYDEGDYILENILIYSSSLQVTT